MKLLGLQTAFLAFSGMASECIETAPSAIEKDLFHLQNFHLQKLKLNCSNSKMRLDAMALRLKEIENIYIDSRVALSSIGDGVLMLEYFLCPLKSRKGHIQVKRSETIEGFYQQSL